MIADFERKIDLIQAEKGITLNELAERLGKSKQCVWRLKKSKNPRSRNIKRIAHALGVPVRYFFDDLDILEGRN